MKIKAIICESLQRNFYYYASKGEHVIDIESIDVYYHEYPDQAHKILQEKIDKTDKDIYDYIIIGYGLCGKVIDKLISNAIPIIMPKAHDCRNILLHSNIKYQEELSKNSRCMYYINSLMEINGVKNVSNQLESIGMGMSYEELIAIYGEENAEYLYSFSKNISESYDTAVYIENKLTKKDFTKEILEISKENNWKFIKVEGEDSMVKDLVDLNLNSNNVILIEPFTMVVYTGDNELLRKEKYRND